MENYQVDKAYSKGDVITLETPIYNSIGEALHKHRENLTLCVPKYPLVRSYYFSALAFLLEQCRVGTVTQQYQCVKTATADDAEGWDEVDGR